MFNTDIFPCIFSTHGWLNERMCELTTERGLAVHAEMHILIHVHWDYTESHKSTSNAILRTA